MGPLLQVWIDSTQTKLIHCASFKQIQNQWMLIECQIFHYVVSNKPDPYPTMYSLQNNAGYLEYEFLS